jgi:hypothetical protein
VIFARPEPRGFGRALLFRRRKKGGDFVARARARGQTWADSGLYRRRSTRVPVFSLYFTGKPETASHSGTAKDDDLGQNIPEIDATMEYQL